MRNNRNKWRFYNPPSKPELSAEEVRYWKQSLKKLLKVGMEFEFNLPEQKKGGCKGDNIDCVCLNIKKGCWEICQRLPVCRKIKSYDTCDNKKKTCTPEKCESCKSFKFKCLGTTCADFCSMCFACEEFAKNCEKCPKRFDPNKDPRQIRENLVKYFEPSHNYGLVSPSGVVEVKEDGSLKGDRGAEIITVGRRVDYWEFYGMAKNIIDRLTADGGYLNERCGSHMHLLTSYYGEHDTGGRGMNEMEKDMPEIILANFHQLCRRYQNAITWMTMALDHPNHMTRWEKFRVSVLEISPVTRDMFNVMREVGAKAGGTDNKYGWVNYRKVRFDNNKIKTFHVEMRAPDSTLCPSYYAAVACLFYAMAIKAAEISRYGLLKVGEEEWMEKAKQMKKLILNGRGDWGEARVADTSRVLDHREYFIEESIDLVNQLKGILFKIGPAYDVLRKLAERPVALRRIEGDSWEEIEDQLVIETTQTDQIEQKMREIIELSLIEDCEDEEEWAEEASRAINEDDQVDFETSKNEVKNFMDAKMREGELIWSESLGRVIAV